MAEQTTSVFSDFLGSMYDIASNVGEKWAMKQAGIETQMVEVNSGGNQQPAVVTGQPAAVTATGTAETQYATGASFVAPYMPLLIGSALLLVTAITIKAFIPSRR